MDYISRQAAIDALWVVQRKLQMSDGDTDKTIYGVQIAMQAVEKLPSADVVEVVRCKECKHRRKITWADGTEHWECIYDSEYDQSSNAEDDDWFCADGEKGGA